MRKFPLEKTYISDDLHIKKLPIIMKVDGRHQISVDGPPNEGA